MTRALNLPRPARVRLSSAEAARHPRQGGVYARHPRQGGVYARHPVEVNGEAVESVRESWLVEDRWWTGTPLRRRYWELVGERGRNIVVFHDLVADRRTGAPGAPGDRSAPGARNAPGGWFIQSS